jgi:uncharacterized surface protein with fasciclin (FAS1) repeats
MRNRFLMSAVALVAGLSLVAAACSDDSEDTTTTTAATEETTDTMDEGTMEEEEASGDTIVDVAVADGRFETLVAAVTAAGLAETLSGPGPFTVFAPTDDAFAALPEGTVETLLEDPQGDLTTILQLHVLGDEVGSQAAIEAAGGCVETIGGGQVKVELDGDVLSVGGANVVVADVEASNGVIHVIDAVITEPSADC